MSNVAIKNFDQLRAAVKESGLTLAAAPKVGPRKQGRGKGKSQATAAPTMNRRPVLPASVNPEEMIGQLVAIIDGAFSGRGFPNVMAFADHAIACLSAAELRKHEGLPDDKSVIRALEQVVVQCGVPSHGSYMAATRGRRLLQMLEETPGVADGNLARVNGKGEIVAAERPRDAASALKLYEAVAGHVNQHFIRDLEIAKATKADSLRDPKMKKLRRVSPDLGVALVAATLQQRGFTKTGLPIPNFVGMNFNTLNWAVKVLADLREVLGTEDETGRGYLLLAHLDESIALDLDSFKELAKIVAEVAVSDGATAAERARAKEKYDADPAKYDAARAQWKGIQTALDDIQQEAINAVDGVLSFIRHKISEKEWLVAEREAEKAEKNGGAREPKAPAEKQEPKVLAPAPRVKQPKAVSVNTPKEALAEVLRENTEVETEMSLPVARTDVLGIGAVELRKEFAAAGVDGPRECVLYPGVIWEAVVGPVWHALDVENNDDNDRVVIIAPRRAGGMGLDLSESRVVMVGEYEEFFSPIVSH
jgi:hypothetical protein